jgi:hypothetical protein
MPSSERQVVRWGTFLQSVLRCRLLGKTTPLRLGIQSPTRGQLPEATAIRSLMCVRVPRQRSWDRLGGLKKGVFLAHRNVQRDEDETSFQFGEGPGRESRQGHPPGDPQAKIRIVSSG